MSPSVIVLNVCVAIFLALFLVFSAFLITRFRKERKQQALKEAKEVPMYNREEPEPESEPDTVLKRKTNYQLAEVD